MRVGRVAEQVREGLRAVGECVEVLRGGQPRHRPNLREAEPVVTAAPVVVPGDVETGPDTKGSHRLRLVGRRNLARGVVAVGDDRRHDVVAERPRRREQQHVDHDGEPREELHHLLPRARVLGAEVARPPHLEAELVRVDAQLHEVGQHRAEGGEREAGREEGDVPELDHLRVVLGEGAVERAHRDLPLDRVAELHFLRRVPDGTRDAVDTRLLGFSPPPPPPLFTPESFGRPL
mmetsp:Transcript_29598/g.96142  ORF Transcript_29598/g.96142 Transcript_29598/m.96142 type:complete len:234 (+) Transcript_29598:912-1613(+)